MFKLFFCVLLQRVFDIFHNLSVKVYNKLERAIPGFSTVMEKVQAESIEREARRRGKREAEKRAEKELSLGKVEDDE